MNINKVVFCDNYNDKYLNENKDFIDIYNILNKYYNNDGFNVSYIEDEDYYYIEGLLSKEIDILTGINYFDYYNNECINNNLTYRFNIIELNELNKYNELIYNEFIKDKLLFKRYIKDYLNLDIEFNVEIIENYEDFVKELLINNKEIYNIYGIKNDLMLKDIILIEDKIYYVYFDKYENMNNEVNKVYKFYVETNFNTFFNKKDNKIYKFNLYDNLKNKNGFTKIFNENININENKKVELIKYKDEYIYIINLKLLLDYTDPYIKCLIKNKVNDNNNECNICLMDIKEYSYKFKYCKCNINYCKNCILKWFKISGVKCIICKKGIDN